MQRALLIAAAVLLLDQLSKWAVLSLIMPPQGAIALTGFFNLVLTYNPGVSFGLSQGETAWQPYLLIAVNLAVAAAPLLWRRKRSGALLIWAVGLVAAGAVGHARPRSHPTGS